MKTNIINTCFVTSLLLLSTVSAQAASIWLEPDSQDISEGQDVNLLLWADASDVGGLLGGGLDLFYDDTVLTYNGDFAFDPSFPTDPALSRPGTTGAPDNCAITPAATGCSVTGEINGIAFGSYIGLAASGPTLVGSLSFTALVSGTSLVTMADNDTPAGSWFATDGTAIDITYVVPVPVAAWLFGSGLIGLIGIARRKKA